jgi:hypothetical protein
MFTIVNEWKVLLQSSGRRFSIYLLTKLYLYNSNYSLDMFFNKE